MTLAEWLAEAEAGRVMYPPEVVAALVRVAMAAQTSVHVGAAAELPTALRRLRDALASPQGTP